MKSESGFSAILCIKRIFTQTPPMDDLRRSGFCLCSYSYLIFVTSITYKKVEKKIGHVEKFQISIHDRCWEIWNFPTWRGISVSAWSKTLQPKCVKLIMRTGTTAKPCTSKPDRNIRKSSFVITGAGVWQEKIKKWKQIYFLWIHIIFINRYIRKLNLKIWPTRFGPVWSPQRSTL